MNILRRLLSFVSTMYFALMKKETIAHPTNNEKHTIRGIKGGITKQKAAPDKLAIVEYGMMFGYTISGIYSHTIGPRVSPKKLINKSIANTTKIDVINLIGESSLTSSEEGVIIKQVNTIAKLMPINMIPSCIRYFLPFLFISLIVNTAITAGIEVIMTCRKSTI